MMQSRRLSALESAVNAALGFAISSAIGTLIFDLPPISSIAMTAACTIASFGRGYLVRRSFAGMSRSCETFPIDATPPMAYATRNEDGVRIHSVVNGVYSKSEPLTKSQALSILETIAVELRRM